jgi:uncharacterized membrane protein
MPPQEPPFNHWKTVRLTMFVRNLLRYGDIYLCMALSLGLALHAGLASAGGPASPILAATGLPLGLGMVILPGYSLALAAGLERRGASTLAGVAIALSLAMIAIIGTMIWLVSNELSVPLFEAMLSSCVFMLSMFAFRRRQRSVAYEPSLSAQWTTLGLLVIVLLATTVVLGDFMPTSPTTRYTEFVILNREPQVVVAIVNREQRPETYTVVAESANGRSQLAPVTVPADAHWTGALPLEPDANAQVQLLLYRAGEQAPYRSLWLQPRSDS